VNHLHKSHPPPKSTICQQKESFVIAEHAREKAKMQRTFTAILIFSSFGFGLLSAQLALARHEGDTMHLNITGGHTLFVNT